jgi:hypothetical protein
MSERYLADENFPAWIFHFSANDGNDVLYAAETLVAVSDEAILHEAVTQPVSC